MPFVANSSRNSAPLSGSLEKELLIQCARTQLSSENVAAIRRLVKAQPDWARTLKEAAAHTIAPLLNRSLRRAASDLVPEAALDNLKEANRANAVRCLHFSAELASLIEVFQAASILAVPYKGPVAASQAYGDVTLREFGDLDIILQHKDILRAHDLLVARGYTPRFQWILSRGAGSKPVPGEYNYTDHSRRIMVELHTERTLRHFPRPPDIRALADPLVMLDIAGQHIRTFSPEVALFLLCLHGSKDFWERLSWIADISEMASSHPALDWDEVFKRAETAGSSRMLHLGLRLAADVLGAQFPSFVVERFESDPVATELSREIEARLLNPFSAPLTAFERFRFRRLLIGGLGSGMRYSLRLTFAPSEDDWQLFALPAALSPLYLVLRPLRLLGKYGVRGRRSGQVSLPSAGRK